MKTITYKMLLVINFFLFASVQADGFLSKEVYSFKSASGTPVFTDKKPKNTKSFETKTIEAAKSTGHTQISTQPGLNYQNNNNSHQSERIQKVVVEHHINLKSPKKKKKMSVSRCKYYKKKFEYFSDRMRAGYRNSEYKYLEKNRVKFRKLLFKNCETKTFSD